MHVTDGDWGALDFNIVKYKITSGNVNRGNILRWLYVPVVRAERQGN